MPMKSLADRLADHTYRADNGCLIWTGAGREGAPVIGTTRAGGINTSFSLRRALYEDRHGPIADGRQTLVRTSCRTDRCVEIAHLVAVSSSELHLEVNASTGRCRSGRHDLTDPANVRIDRRGRRQGCVPCLREKQRAYRIAERDDGRLAARKRRQPVPDAAS